MIAAASDLLEFSALRELLGRFVHTALGRRELDALAPSTDRAWIESTLADTSEAVAYMRASYEPQAAQRGAAIRPRFDSIPDIGASAAMLRIQGAVLEARQIYDLAHMLDQAAEIRSVIDSAAERFPRLAAKAADITDLRELLREVRGKILPDGSVADDASPVLNRLRRDIERQQRNIQVSLDRFLRSHRDDGTLQEDFVTIRNDRFVVPIVAGQERKIGGVIHGASGSGHTLFVEPLETIDLNNELVRLREEEQQEVERILARLTQLLREHAEEIARTADALGKLELLFAKAAFAREFDAVIPAFSAAENRRLVLDRARHPLLEDILRAQSKSAVPISLTLDERCRTLLISGPNTGGKTVSLKTVGLLSLMAQAGLPVPAASAEFPVFEQVLADIGDQQSIQESLSSFSAHIAHVREMLEHVTPDSLVLLDELGRATDPEEGGALGTAILERFQSHGAFTLASTHLLALKMYGATAPGVVNASMGFDEETLQPTYILRVGAPGKSAGLAVAGRIGIDPAIIESARSRMTSQERDIARFLTELHTRLDKLAADERDLGEKREALDERARELERQYEKRDAARVRELERRTDAALAAFDAQARETIEKIVEQSEQRKAAEQARSRVARTRREFEDTVRTAVLGKQPERAPAAAIEEGALVRLRGIREPARVRRKLSDGRVEVQAGLIKMQVALEDIEQVLPGAQETARLPQNVRYDSGPAWNVTYREVNVIGKHAEEAIAEVDKFLDTAAMASVDRVRIVHGHGMGILRRAISDLLANNPHVEKFYAASPAEGGTGATVVELK